MNYIRLWFSMELQKDIIKIYILIYFSIRVHTPIKLDLYFSTLYVWWCILHNSLLCSPYFPHMQGIKHDAQKQKKNTKPQNYIPSIKSSPNNVEWLIAIQYIFLWVIRALQCYDLARMQENVFGRVMAEDYDILFRCIFSEANGRSLFLLLKNYTSLYSSYVVFFSLFYLFYVFGSRESWKKVLLF
jgi:hypothetical protein